MNGGGISSKFNAVCVKSLICSDSSGAKEKTRIATITETDNMMKKANVVALITRLFR